MNRNNLLGRKLRRKLGALAFDLPRLVPLLALRSGWLRFKNRDEILDLSDDRNAVACRGEWSSDIHACAEFPKLAGALMSRALNQWPISTSSFKINAQRPEISFVIAHRGTDRLPLLKLTVESILTQRDVSVECIVVDQSIGSEPIELPKGVRHMPVTHPVDPEPWRKSWAYNLGAAAAQAEIVIFHDGDILVPEGYAAEALRQLGSGGYDVAHLQRFLFCLGERETHDLVAVIGKFLPGMIPERVRQNWRGGTLAIRKKAFEAIGGFDERFVGWGGEDIEFYDRCRLLKQQRFGYLPFVHLWHPPQDSKFGASRSVGLGMLGEMLQISRETRALELRNAGKHRLVS